MATTKMAGSQGYVKIGGTRLDVLDWEFNRETEKEDITSTENYDVVSGNVFSESLATVIKGSGKFSAVWDSTKPPVANPPNINAGVELELKLKIGSTSKYINIPRALVTSVPITSGAKAAVKYTCNFDANGVFTIDS